MNPNLTKLAATAAITLFFSVHSLAAKGNEILSPDGKLSVKVECTDGQPSYTVTLDGISFLESSPLGLKMNTGDFSKEMQLANTSDPFIVKDSYSLPNIKKSNVDYCANGRTFTFSDMNGTPIYDVEFQVSDNNVAFRYHFLPVKETKCAVVLNEATGFTMPEGTTTFLCPQSGAMGGFARTSPSYETSYTVDDSLGNNGWGNGYTFPCLFRNGDNGWTLISETGVDGNYCASRLLGGKGQLYTIGFPLPEEMNGAGSVTPAVTLDSYSPWRTITVGRDLAPIVETTVPFDVVKPKYDARYPHGYGKGTWSWIIGMDTSMNFDEQKRYIDFSADLGYESVLVDALWDTQVGYGRVEELARYGKSKGVDLYLWYNSNGSWNDAPQGPRGRMNRSRERRQEMAWMQKNGIRGIKVDFFGGDKQEMMKLYEDILADANDFGLLVIFHGCTLPRGWERMFPAFAASEAVLASENLHFSQDFCNSEAFNATLHPFIRNAVGSMDYGGSCLNRWHNEKNEPGRGTERKTSDVFALATAVLFQSPVQHFSLAPNNLTDAPAWAVDFMKSVPTIWDDVKYIDGYPGKYAVIARRSGDTWYVAGVNAEEKSQKLKIVLPGLENPTMATLYTDSDKLQVSVKEIKLKKPGLSVSIPTNGAFVLTYPAQKR